MIIADGMEVGDFLEVLTELICLLFSIEVKHGTSGV